ncbi:MAG: ABC transporter permease subunit [Thermoanaerobaculia bacterium]
MTPESAAATSPRRPDASPAAARAVDLVLLAVLAASIAGIVALAEEWGAPLREAAPIDLSPSALPVYTLLSLSRGLAAYVLSLAFTLVVGTLAAHSRRAERLLIPLLDIGQGIPVLGFLPGLVLGMVALFPRTNVGLELACIVMIFTGQVWNMAFSFYGSLKGVPAELYEVARLNRFSRWKTFRTVEFPSAVIGLVWNSMMSMAGGWFFLTVNEAFVLGGRDFRLPGVGSYMAVAIERGDVRAMVWAVVAMTAMIVAVDQLLWRPLVVWSQRFRVEELGSGEEPRSWVVSLVKGSNLLRGLRRSFRTRRQEARARAAGKGPVLPAAPAAPVSPRVLALGLLAASAVALALWGTVRLAGLLLRVPAREWGVLGLALGATGLRTAGALALSVLWAVPAGILLGRSPTWSRRLQPVVQIVASFPAPMLYPLVTAVLLALRVPFALIAAVLMVLGAQWYVLFNVLAGASAVPGDLGEAASVYRLSGIRRFRTLDLPAVFPFLVTGLVTAAGGAWNASIVAETLVFRGSELTTFGLGSLITQATHEGNFPLLAAGVLTMSLALVLLNRTVWRRLYRLAATRFALNR